MSRDSKRSSRTSRGRSLALVFGEDYNDTQAIAVLIAALCPRLAGRVKARRSPPVLLRDAKPEDVRPRADRLAAIAAAETRLRGLVCVFAHEDADAVEPAHIAIAERIEKALKAAGVQACAVVPAWELESWWLLWPEAVHSVHPSWSKPDQYRGKNVGMISNAKEELRRRFRSADGKSTYQESDSKHIAAAVERRGEVRAIQGTSASYARFVKCVEECCDQA